MGQRELQRLLRWPPVSCRPSPAPSPGQGADRRVHHLHRKPRARPQERCPWCARHSTLRRRRGSLRSRRSTCVRTRRSLGFPVRARSRNRRVVGTRCSASTRWRAPAGMSRTLWEAAPRTSRAPQPPPTEMPTARRRARRAVLKLGAQLRAPRWRPRSTQAGSPQRWGRPRRTCRAVRCGTSPEWCRGSWTPGRRSGRLPRGNPPHWWGSAKASGRWRSIR